ncbi:MAG TPA: tripartite tricarboxylate transporter substrate binding protein, partial [Burkholderiales bacterium]|nr:tripartite tricarboxylate transporter substrate binding protein [Burkholderiales bacterium]
MTNPIHVRIARFLIGLVCALGAALAVAQEYPAKPINIVVPLLAGSASDVIGRTFAPEFSKALGQPVIIDNKAGAATTIGASYVVKSPPDGYTVLLATSSTLSVLPSVQAMPFDPVKDLMPVAAYARTPMMVLVSAESPYKSLAEFVSAARAAPGKLTFASTGVGTVTYMAVELFSVVANIRLTHVPYKASAGSYTDVMGGRVDMVMGAPASTMALITGGKFRPLAISSPQRSPALPNVPTFAELGFAGAESDYFDGLAVPAGTPKAIVARLEAEALKI